MMKRDEWSPGSKVVYVKAPTYRPRQDPPSGLAGGKAANVDRVEWVIIPDAQTALNALQAGEIDIFEEIPPDMNRKTGRRQGWGLKQVLLRMNGVTGDPKAVRAEFADAAQFVLQQRVRNLPSNRVFEVGWLRRVATYRRPIADPPSSPERALRKSLRVTAAQ